MTYATSNPPKLLVAGMGGGPSIWYYKSDDAHGDVDGTDYFTNAKDLGMKDNDIVLVVDEDTGTTTIHHVTTIDSDGNGTLSVATFS